MRKFLSQPVEKQNKIVSAAMKVFGEAGYKKAYVSEIALEAGISKALIFHYFGSKKGLYSYLVYYTGKVMMTEGQEARDTQDKDFFDRAMIITKFRLSIIERHPAMNSFIESVFNEDNTDVIEDRNRLLAIATDMHAKIILKDEEEDLFKGGINHSHIINLVSTYIEGVVQMLSENKQVDEVMQEASESFQLLKAALYK